MFSGLSSPPSGSRMSSAAGAPCSPGRRGEERVHGTGNRPERACSSPRAFSMRRPISCSSFALSSFRLPTWLEIDAHQIEVFVRRPAAAAVFFVFVVGFGLGVARSGSSSRLPDAGRRRLPGRLRRPAAEAGARRLRRPRRRERCRTRGPVDASRDVGIAIRLGPVNERIVITARAAASGLGIRRPGVRECLRGILQGIARWLSGNVLCSAAIGGRQLLP